MPLPLIISFDGNIGSGKSTTCEEYEQYLRNEINKCGGSEKAPLFPNITSFEEEICFLDEPVALWNAVCDENGVNILTNLYKNIRANAFKFQMMAYISRLSLLRKAVKDPKIKLIITERSVETDRNVFAKMLYDVGDISHDEFQIYTLWFDEFLTDVPLGGIVYIHASPDVCLERIHKRARSGETIQADYIQRCHQYHEDWIRGRNCPLLELPANEDMNKTTTVMLERMERITEFIWGLLDQTVVPPAL
jgi:deoxyadenosine/deoxycytidine kinase